MGTGKLTDELARRLERVVAAMEREARPKRGRGRKPREGDLEFVRSVDFLKELNGIRTDKEAIERYAVACFGADALNRDVTVVRQGSQRKIKLVAQLRQRLADARKKYQRKGGFIPSA